LYDTKDEAHQKLTSCLCLFNGESAYIENVHGSGKKIQLDFFHIRQKIQNTENINHNGWEFRELGNRIGYMNIDMGHESYKEAAYTVRSAVRIAHNTQCLSFKNMRIKPLRGAPHLGVNGFKIDWQSVVRTDYAADMIEGKYPCMKDIKDQFLKEPYQVSMAFTREFAVYRPEIGPFYLEYKGKQIGYSDDADQWKIGSKYLYLTESLDHNGLKVA